MRDLIRLARPEQWTKNLTCLAGLFFGGHLFAWPLALKAGLVFAGFCCVSSAVYVVNDVVDRHVDRLHPKKKDRPVAAEKIGVRGALVVAAALFVAGFSLFGKLGEEYPATATAAGIYVVLNLLYTLRLKALPLIDVNIIALGFVMRVAAGAFAIPVTPTRWILLCTFFLALFVAMGKRRAELTEVGDDTPGRIALAGYDGKVLDAGLRICAALVVAVYTLYCIFSPEHESRLVLVTVIPVAVGVMRYLAMAQDGLKVVAPERVVFTDAVLGLSVLVWAGMFGYLLYGQ